MPANFKTWAQKKAAPKCGWKESDDLVFSTSDPEYKRSGRREIPNAQEPSADHGVVGVPSGRRAKHSRGASIRSGPRSRRGSDQERPESLRPAGRAELLKRKPSPKAAAAPPSPSARLRQAAAESPRPARALMSGSTVAKRCFAERARRGEPGQPSGRRSR